MEPAQVVEMENLRDRVGKLLNNIKATSSEEWEAVEKLTAAHKQLRGIDTNALRQGKLIE